jgi:alpha-N-arabinofuranosidase
VLAAFSGDRRKVLISIVNPTEEACSLSPTLSGVKVGERGRLYQIAPPSLNSTNEAVKDPVVTIVESAQVGLPDTIQVPPVSVSVYEFDVA